MSCTYRCDCCGKLLTPPIQKICVNKTNSRDNSRHAFYLDLCIECDLMLTKIIDSLPSSLRDKNNEQVNADKRKMRELIEYVSSFLISKDNVALAEQVYNNCKEVFEL